MMAKCNLQDKCIKYSTCNHGQSKIQSVYDFSKICLNKEYAWYSEFYDGAWRITPEVDKSGVEGVLEGDKEGSDEQ